VVVFTPNPGHAFAPTPRAATPGTIGWHELYTSDLEADSTSTASSLAGPKVSDMDMGPMGLYRIFDEGDHKQMGDGGMMNKAPQITRLVLELLLLRRLNQSGRQNVLNPAAGKVINGPMQDPAAAGSINGQDPLGAMFSLVSSNE